MSKIKQRTAYATLVERKTKDPTKTRVRNMSQALAWTEW
jgi:hypothetical protein